MLRDNNQKAPQVTVLVLICCWCLPSLVGCSARAPEAPAASSQAQKIAPADTNLVQDVALEAALAAEQDPERDSWQRPDWLLQRVGVAQGQVVVELGAGTGYFIKHLLARGAVVVAAEPESTRIAYLHQQRHTLGADSNRVQVRHISYREPMLRPQEAQYILLVNSYAYLPYRSYYARKLHRGLQRGGHLVVVDWLQQSKLGPVPALRVAPQQVMTELREAGFRSFEVDSTTLPYQYIVIAE